MPPELFHRPATGWVGDVIPFLDGDTHRLFYLHDRRDESHPGTAWNVVSTKDFVHYTDHGVALAHGGADDLDLNAYTGSVVRDDEGVHHLFYTGYNPAVTDEAGIPLQHVMHATSTDGMQTWTKHPEDTFRAPLNGYEAGDWRDPFVYRADGGTWAMLLAARTDQGPARRRGVVARCVSTDLRTWTVVEPLWVPHRFVTHECPDLFRMGDWWYLMYSEFSDAYTTRYVRARAPEGPWQTPRFDTVDGRGFYAAKTDGDDSVRHAYGWIPSREDESDDGAYQWAGSLAVHEVTQLPDGTLAFSLPQSIRAAFDAGRAATLTPVIGPWVRHGNQLSATTAAGYACAVTEVLPEQCLIRAEFDIGPGTHEVGLVLRASDDGDEGYMLRLEPQRQRMVFDRWPRPTTGPLQWQISGDVPHLVELERPAELADGHHVLEVLLEQTAFIAYLDGRVALSGRIYDRPSGRAAVVVAAGSATFSAPVVSTR